MTTLTDHAAGLGLSLPPGAAGLLEGYAARVAAAARTLDLTSLTEAEAIRDRHIAEGLGLLALLRRCGILPPGRAAEVIDIGSGAGFPGLILKVAEPALRVTLLEARRKKAAFLQRTVTELDLNGVRVVAERAEVAAHDPLLRARFDLALARGLAPLPVLAELVLPFLTRGGYLATPKGSRLPDELAAASHALEVCGGAVVAVHPLPGAVAPAPQVLLVRKVTETPQRYPRRPGIPQKRPL